jgi:hypothetical protein
LATRFELEVKPIIGKQLFFEAEDLADVDLPLPTMEDFALI